MAGMALEAGRGRCSSALPAGDGDRGQKVNPLTVWQTIVTQSGNYIITLQSSIFTTPSRVKTWPISTISRVFVS